MIVPRPSDQRRPLFLNPGSGLHELPLEELEARLPGFAVQETSGPELADAIGAAMSDGIDVIAIAGGDGTIRTAAATVADSDTALLVLPGGTRNHFAKALGLPDLDAACRAASEGVCESVDLGEVNGCVFVNNATIGWYAAMVATRETWERRVPRTLARIVALAVHLPRVGRFGVRAAGHELTAWVVWVGNGRITSDLGELGERADMSDGVLDVWVARADGRFPRLRLFSDLLVGRLATSPRIERWSTEEMMMRMRRSTARVALDGEVLRLAVPLHFEVRPGALRVLVPSDSPVAATP